MLSVFVGDLGAQTALERLRDVTYCSLPSVSSLVPGNAVERRQFIFLCYVHTYSIHIYLYHNLRNQKVEFPMESLFFNNQLFLNVIKTIILYSYRVWGGHLGGRRCSGGFVSAFPSGFYFWLFFVLFCFFVGHFCIAGICANTVAKIMTCSKDFKTKYFSFCKRSCVVWSWLRLYYSFSAHKQQTFTTKGIHRLSSKHTVWVFHFRGQTS